MTGPHEAAVSSSSLLGRRMLARVRYGPTSASDGKRVDEYRLLEISPSGKWWLMLAADGAKLWRPCSDVELIEELPESALTPRRTPHDEQSPVAGQRPANHEAPAMSGVGQTLARRCHVERCHVDRTAITILSDQQSIGQRTEFSCRHDQCPGPMASMDGEQYCPFTAELIPRFGPSDVR